ncbi:MAG TPA: peptidoglycan DD-metalloendopeptidase family protein [Micromonosporaceae bacterium]|nr:peptidoglycan DD-metalloendopeptidase family protein [Micromonosporaceae bacterium]
MRTGPRHRSALAIMTLLACSAALAVPAPALADPRDDKRRIDAEVAKAAAMLESATARAQAAARQYAEATAALPAAELRVTEARKRVVAAETAAEDARREVRVARSGLNAANARLGRSEVQVALAQERLGAMAAAAYKGSGVTTLRVLIEAGSPANLADRLGYLNSIADHQQAALDRVAAARAEAKRANDAALAARRRADQARQAAERALAETRTQRAAVERAALDLAALVTARKAALEVAAQERSASLARYEQLKRESAQIEAELRAWEEQQRRQGTTPGPVLRPGARLLMPVHGWKSSDFGMRYDPFYRVWQLHAGVDIAAGGGQPIYAAADGRVLRAGWNGGYGNYTCIYHGQYNGSSMVTCYAHQSRMHVSTGQWVRRGTVIGRVGTTGASTGNHLHFEVRIGGRPVQPLNWLPTCLC